jgi:hypothetical protein
LFFDIHADEALQMVSKRNHVLLSQSVGVTMPKTLINQSHRIQIVHDLELSHRPRYKSDYLAQNGNKRKPRYVADQNGNHFVTLKVILTLYALYFYIMHFMNIIGVSRH